MKVLTIGTDKKLFEEESAVLVRQKEYASKIDELDIVVFSLKKEQYKSVSFGNLHIYPTNSSTRFSYISDAVKIGKEIIQKNGLNKGYFVISTQDPFETGLVGYKLKKKFNLPLQIQIHTDFLSSYFKNSFLNHIRVVIANFLIPKADALRVVSTVIEDSLNKKFQNIKNKINVLPILLMFQNF